MNPRIARKRAGKRPPVREVFDPSGILVPGARPGVPTPDPDPDLASLALAIRDLRREVDVIKEKLGV